MDFNINKEIYSISSTNSSAIIFSFSFLFTWGADYSGDDLLYHNYTKAMINEIFKYKDSVFKQVVDTIITIKLQIKLNCSNYDRNTTNYSNPNI